MVVTEHPHIVANTAGQLVIVGTRIELSVLIESHLAYGSDATQLRAQFPDIMLAQGTRRAGLLLRQSRAG
ncbi:MAG TPA: hypothetical protein PLD59_11920 [Tepidisphaeraceae bacterium]|nr:hypothetical protein [Tepidisphaeraceae bacterium]